MGSPNREARTTSPERLKIKQIEVVEPSPNGYQVDVTLTVSYEAWDNPSNDNELKDAVVAVYRAIDDSRSRAEKKRMKRLEKEYKNIG